MLVLPHDKGAILQRMEAALRAVSEVAGIAEKIFTKKQVFLFPANAAELPALESLLTIAAGRRT
jgi:hypothetical protein